MNKLLLLLSVLMGVVVLLSNYLVQFPIKYYGLEKILTYGAFTYPIAFLITDLANRSYGKLVARKIVYIGFVTGITFTIFFLNRHFKSNFNKNCHWIRCCFYSCSIIRYKNF